MHSDAPVAEAAAEPVRHRVHAECAQELADRAVRELASPNAWEHEIAGRGGARNRPRLLEHGERLRRQRHSVFGLRLHPRGRDRPGVAVDFGPRGAARFAASAAGQHDELENQLRRLPGVARPHSREGVGDFGMGQRLVMLHLAGAFRQGLENGRAGRVVGSVAVGDGPPHDRRNPLPNAARGPAPVAPDGREHRHHVGAVDCVDPLVADRGEGVGGEGAFPLLPALGIRPRDGLGVDHLGCGVGERRRGRPAALLEGVAAAPGDPAVGERGVPRFGERDQRIAAEARAAPPAPDHDALHPALGSGRLDGQHQAVPQRVDVPVDAALPGVLDGAHERDCQRPFPVHAYPFSPICA